jgi:hypothetical protein
MSKAFTPGPWKFFWRQPSNETACVFSADDAVDGKWICDLSPLRMRDETEANAALIAAAPAMFEALTKAAETFRAYERLHRAKETPEGLAKAEANARTAEMCEAALSQAQPQPSDEVDG